MASDAQIKANRANSRKSSGPKTSAGKQRSATNALRHGLLSDSLVLVHEDQRQFDALLEGLIDYHTPVGTTEFLLIEKMAICLWKQRRLNAVESASIRLNQISQQNSRLEQLLAARGFPLSPGEPDDTLKQLKEIQLALPLNDDRLIRYQTMLDNQYYRALKTLRELQEARIAAIEAIPITAEPPAGA